MGKYIFNSLIKYLHFESNKGRQIQFMHKTNIEFIRQLLNILLVCKSILKSFLSHI